MKIGDFSLRGWGAKGAKDIHYTFFGNVVRRKSALFRLVMRNGFAHFVQKVFVRRKLLPGKFWVFAPLRKPMQNLIEPGRDRVVNKNTVVGSVVYEAGGMAARNTFWPSEIVFVFVFLIYLYLYLCLSW